MLHECPRECITGSVWMFGNPDIDISSRKRTTGGYRPGLRIFAAVIAASPRSRFGVSQSDHPASRSTILWHRSPSARRYPHSPAELWLLLLGARLPCRRLSHRPISEQSISRNHHWQPRMFPTYHDQALPTVFQAPTPRNMQDTLRTRLRRPEFARDNWAELLVR